MYYWYPKTNVTQYNRREKSFCDAIGIPFALQGIEKSLAENECAIEEMECKVASWKKKTESWCISRGN
nr:hypothetical protein [Tanacetum cinerariifolium]